MTAPIPDNDPQLFGRFTSSRAMDLATIGSLLLGLAASALTLFLSIANEDWIAAGAGGGLLVVVLFLLWLLVRAHSPVNPVETKTFRPFQRLEPGEVWHRPTERDQIIDAVLDNRETVPVVVGASGAGKSTLLQVMVKEELERSHPETRCEVIYEGYERLGDKLESIRRAAGDGGRTVVVLDQFEDWLAYVARQPCSFREAEEAWLLETLTEAAKSPNCTFLLSIRQEWYYDLRFLGDLVPSPAEVCEVGSPLIDDKDDKMRQGAVESFTEVLSDRELAEKIVSRLSANGGLSPLEAQIVGAAVESGNREGKKIDLDYFDTLGGVDGAIDAYFKAILDGFERPRACVKIMCALSAKTRFREKTELNHILAGVFEHETIVRAALQYLVEKKLVVDHSGGGRYELAHDFLAEFYSHKSIAELSPLERDNILAQVASEGKFNQHVLLDVKREQLSRRRWGRWVLLSLLVLMGLRLAHFGIDLTVGPSLARPLSGAMLDASFLLILIPYALWIAYVAAFYDRVFIYLKESKLQRGFSLFVLVNMVVATLAGILVPFAWILALGIGGMVFALKFVTLARRPELNAFSRRWLSWFGTVTSINMGIVTAVGAVATYLSFAYVDADSYADAWLIANMVASGLLTYWCLAVMPVHITRSGTSRMLGLLGRQGPKREPAHA